MNHKISFRPDTMEIMNNEQPSTITIDGVEIPSWYKVWVELQEVKRRSGLRTVQYIALLCAVISLIISTSTLLWK